MRYKHFLSSLLFYPLCVFANNLTNSHLFFITTAAIEDHTIERSLSSEKNFGSVNQNLEARTLNHPTQVIRISKNIEEHQVTCEEVNDQIDKILINKITKDKFYYTTYISCTYDPETQIARKFSILSYFDPLTDEAINYLKTYLEEYNGIDLWGATLNIESAKALIVSLSISIGMKKNPSVPPFVEYREDHSNFYFSSNYDLQTNLIIDAKQRFFSDEPDKVLPFLDKWVFDHAGLIYKAILRDSNYALMQPERIFLMPQGEPIFVSPIKYYYAHNCSKYEHQHCLKQEL